jgi:regulator of sirC expression with transglutaminase-like and TPR domain
MPITLSILVVEVARRAGLSLEGIGLPGHFVVGGPELPADTYLDPFHGGELCGREVLARRIASIFGAPVALPDAVFAPDSSRAILTRVLLNLRASYEQRDRFEEALEALRFAEALEPEEAAFLREKGILLLRSGRSEEALAALDAYVRLGTGKDLAEVRKLVAILRRQAAVGAEQLALEPSQRKIFTLEEARVLLPRVQQITSDAVFRYARLGGEGEAEEERQEVVRDWAREIVALGVEIKGLWLVDFDSGAGYYCWKYPEPSLDFFHGYEEGFAGRLPLQ